MPRRSAAIICGAGQVQPLATWPSLLQQAWPRLVMARHGLVTAWYDAPAAPVACALDVSLLLAWGLKVGMVLARPWRRSTPTRGILRYPQQRLPWEEAREPLREAERSSQGHHLLLWPWPGAIESEESHARHAIVDLGCWDQ